MSDEYPICRECGCMAIVTQRCNNCEHTETITRKQYENAERARLAVELCEARDALDAAQEAFDDHYGEVSGCPQCQEATCWEEMCDAGQSLDAAKEAAEDREFSAYDAWQTAKEGASGYPPRA